MSVPDVLQTSLSNCKPNERPEFPRLARPVAHGRPLLSDIPFRYTATSACFLYVSATPRPCTYLVPIADLTLLITQWSLYLGLSVEATVDLIVAVAQCLLLKGFETGIRRCVSAARRWSLLLGGNANVR